MPVEELSVGLAAGAVAAVAVGVAAMVAHQRGAAWPVPIGGIGLVLAALVAIASAVSVPPGVAAATLGVALTRVLPIAQRSPVAGVALAFPFAVWLAVDASSTTWIRVVVAAGASLGAVLVAETDGRTSWADLTPPMYAITAAGVFLAVPDTEQAAALLGVAAMIGLLGWPVGLVSLGAVGSAGATALLMWVVAVGGRGRPPSIVGGAACLGLLAAVPVGEWVSRRLGLRRRRRRIVIACVLVHGAVVLLASRGAGITDDMGVAVLLSGVAIATAVAGAIAMASPRSAVEAPPLPGLRYER